MLELSVTSMRDCESCTTNLNTPALYAHMGLVTLMSHMTFWREMASSAQFGHNTRLYSARTTKEENIGFRLVCSMLSTIFTRSCTKWFLPFSFSTKCSEWQKLFQEDGEKTFVKIFLTSKPVEFYLRGINKLADRWQEAIQNNG